MANELSYRHELTGRTVYATIRSEATRQMWNTAGTPALETLTVANWADYDIALAETPASSYFHVGDWPAGLTTVGNYWVDVYEQAGVSPAIGDELLGKLFGYWDGTGFKLAMGGEIVEYFDDSGFDKDELLEDIEDVLIEAGFDADDVATATRVELGMAASDLDTQLAALLAAIGTGGGGGWTDALTESYPAVGAAPTPAQLLFMILALVLQPDLDGTTMSARGLDGTVVMTFEVTLNSANYPVKMIRKT